MPANPRDPDETVNLWEFDPGSVGWVFDSSGPRSELAARAVRLADVAREREDFRTAWQLTDPDVQPGPLLDRNDPDVFTPFPTVTAPDAPFDPFSGLDIPEPEKPALPPEPPISTVLAWRESKAPRVAVRSTLGGWYIDGYSDTDGEALSWQELNHRWANLGVDVATVGVAAAWHRLAP